jgi:hypothetical protein
MATIITISGATRFYISGTGDLVEAHNASVTNLNNELVTKLPLAGGTMQGDVNMDSHKITNLPAPVDNADAARKVDLDGKVNNTGNETIAGVKTFSSAPVVPAATWGRADMKAGRRVVLIPGMIVTGTSNMTFGNAAVASGQGLPMLRAGIITGMTVIDASLNVVSDTQVYVATGTAADGRFAAGDRLYINRNISTGVTVAKINGTTVTNLSQTSSATDDLVVMLEVEFDD